MVKVHIGAGEEYPVYYIQEIKHNRLVNIPKEKLRKMRKIIKKYDDLQKVLEKIFEEQYHD